MLVNNVAACALITRRRTSGCVVTMRPLLLIADTRYGCIITPPFAIVAYPAAPFGGVARLPCPNPWPVKRLGDNSFGLLVAVGWDPVSPWGLIPALVPKPISAS